MVPCLSSTGVGWVLGQRVGLATGTLTAGFAPAQPALELFDLPCPLVLASNNSPWQMARLAPTSGVPAECHRTCRSHRGHPRQTCARAASPPWLRRHRRPRIHLSVWRHHLVWPKPASAMTAVCFHSFSLVMTLVRPLFPLPWATAWHWHSRTYPRWSERHLLHSWETAACKQSPCAEAGCRPDSPPLHCWAPLGPSAGCHALGRLSVSVQSRPMASGRRNQSC